MIARLVFVTLMLLSTNVFAEGLVVGSKKFTESVILGEIVRLDAKTKGVDVTHREQLGGTRVLFSALKRGDIDLYPEYTGTISEEIYSGAFNATDLETMKTRLSEDGIGMSAALGFENTYALGLLDSRAIELGVDTISDLLEHPDLKLGFGNEFLDRGDGWAALKKAYALPHQNVRGLDHDLAYKGIETQSIDLMDVYTTDAEIDYYKMATLTDDRRHFPKYEAVLLYRLDAFEPIRETIAGIEGAIDVTTMRRLNRAVKIDKQSETEIAAAFLELQHEEVGDSIWQRIWTRTLEHLFMVLLSLGAAILVSVPLGVFAFRHAKVGQVVLSVTGLFQTIPSLALLVFMIPLLGIGTTPAIVALFLYSLLPIVRSTHAGLSEIDPTLRRAAAGIGMSTKEITRCVEIPLTLRSILSGVKTAAVINVGTATLGALIGAGGYGQPILTGIRLDDIGTVLEGAIPAALLALVVQWSFDLLERFAVSPGLKA